MAKNTPIYADIASIMEEEIRGLAPNSLLPTEEQLSNRFGVSRVTVRTALDLLENSGMISRLRGRGTIVSPQKVTRNFAPLSSFERDMTSQGIAFRTTVLSFETGVTPPERIRQNLALDDGDTVGCVSMTRSVDDRIICHDQRYYPDAIAVRIDPDRLVNEDSSKVLEDVLASTIENSNWESEIVHASSEVAGALGIASRSLVLANEYTWFVEGGRPAESGIISYRIDRCKFRFANTFSHNGTNSKNQA